MRDIQFDTVSGALTTHSASGYSPVHVSSSHTHPTTSSTGAGAVLSPAGHTHSHGRRLATGHAVHSAMVHGTHAPSAATSTTIPHVGSTSTTHSHTPSAFNPSSHAHGAVPTTSSTSMSHSGHTHSTTAGASPMPPHTVTPIPFTTSTIPTSTGAHSSGTHTVGSHMGAHTTGATTAGVSTVGSHIPHVSHSTTPVTGHGSIPHSATAGPTTTHGHNTHSIATSTTAHNVRYRFTVTAINFLGEGPASLQKDINMGTAVSMATTSFALIDLFAAPADLKVTHVTESSIGVSWVAEGQFMDAEFYNIYFAPMDVTDEDLVRVEQIDAPATEIVLTGLKSDTTYEIYVTSQDGAFISRPSETLVQATGEFYVDSNLEVPVAPEGLIAFEVSQDSCVLAWEYPEATLTGFVVSYTNKLTGKTNTKEVKINQMIIDVFEPDHSYEIKVAGVNQAGTGNYSESIEVHTLVLANPETPAAPEVFRVEDDLKVQWTAPHDGGASITSFSVNFKDGNG